MNSSTRHPGEEQLLRYADGELPGRKAKAVRAHLESCWQCRAELEALQQTIGECVRYRNTTLATAFPPPPEPWGDIYQKFTQLEETSANAAPFLSRLFRTMVRWAPVPVAAALVFVAYQHLQRAPSVQAAELLRKAVAAADSRPAASRRIEIRTKSHSVTRQAGVRAASEIPALADIAALFRAARYNWDDPLSARSYEEWRNGLDTKRDEVMTQDGSYQVRTTTDRGELLSATLKLDRTDFRPVEERFEFRNQEWVEISEAAPELPTASAPALSAPPVAIPSPAVPEPRPAGPAEELQVLAALHRVGADLGDPIEVTRDQSRIVVSGVGIATARQEQVHHALDNIPNVVVRFSEPSAPAGSAPEAQAPAATSEWQERIQQQLGGGAAYEHFSSQAFDMADAIMARAYALRRLAERFPAGIELQPAARQTLMDINRDHAGVLRRQAAEIERLVRPVLAGVGASGREPQPVAAASWQAAADEVFRAARRTESSLATMLGAAPPAIPSAQLPSQALTAIAELRSAVQGCERLLAQDSGGR